MNENNEFGLKCMSSRNISNITQNTINILLNINMQCVYVYECIIKEIVNQQVESVRIYL